MESAPICISREYRYLLVFVSIPGQLLFLYSSNVLSVLGVLSLLITSHGLSTVLVLFLYFGTISLYFCNG